MFDGECTATIRRNGDIVHDIAFTAEATDCNFADKIGITVNQQTGEITASVSDRYMNLINKTFTLLVSVPEYGLTDSQTVTLKGLY